MVKIRVCLALLVLGLSACVAIKPLRPRFDSGALLATDVKLGTSARASRLQYMVSRGFVASDLASTDHIPDEYLFRDQPVPLAVQLGSSSPALSTEPSLIQVAEHGQVTLLAPKTGLFAFYGADGKLDTSRAFMLELYQKQGQRYMAFWCTNCAAGGAKWTDQEAAAWRQKGWLVGGDVHGAFGAGKLPSSQTLYPNAKPVDRRQMIHIHFKGENPADTHAGVYYVNLPSDQLLSLLFAFHATYWPLAGNPVSEPQAPAGDTVTPPSTLPTGGYHPGWIPSSQRTEGNRFCFAFEMESTLDKSSNILEVYRPSMLTDAEWAKFTLAGKLKVAKSCHKTSSHEECKKGTSLYNSPEMKPIIQKVTKDLLDFEQYVVCDTDCRSTSRGEKASLPELCALGGQPATNLKSFAAPHLHQEMSPDMFEILHKFCEPDLEVLKKQLKCMHTLLGDLAVSLHLHMSMVPPSQPADAKLVVAMAFTGTDVVNIGNFEEDWDKRFIAVADNDGFSKLMRQLDQGYISQEYFDEGDFSRWGPLKPSRVAIRHHVYKRGRIGFEFRLGALFYSKLRNLDHNIPSALSIPARIDFLVDWVKGKFVTPLASENWGGSVGMRLLGTPTMPPGYNLYHNYVNVKTKRKATTCAAANDCPFAFDAYESCVQAWVASLGTPTMKTAGFHELAVKLNSALGTKYEDYVLGTVVSKEARALHDSVVQKINTELAKGGACDKANKKLVETDIYRTLFGDSTSKQKKSTPYREFIFASM